jgi:hypothetical protein
LGGQEFTPDSKAELAQQHKFQQCGQDVEEVAENRPCGTSIKAVQIFHRRAKVLQRCLKAEALESLD